MKKFVVLVIMVMVAFSVNAESTGIGQYYVPSNPAISPYVSEYINSVAQHGHQLAKRHIPVGVGMDTKIVDFDGGPTYLETQLRYDKANKERSAMLVLKNDATPFIKKGFRAVCRLFSRR